MNMGQAIGNFLPSAVGVAISPLPIVAVVLMLVTPRGRTNGPSFVIGWCIGLAVVGAIVLAIAGLATPNTASGPATWVDVLFLILGLLLILVAAKQPGARTRCSSRSTLSRESARRRCRSLRRRC
jgi:hypothetical protein